MQKDKDKITRHKFIIEIDSLVGKGAIEDMNVKLLVLINDNEYSDDFKKIILGYTSMYKKELSNWNVLHSMLYGKK